MSNLKVDNLKPEASASEMEQAILELQGEKTDIPEAVEKEAVEEKAPKTEVKEDAPPAKEFVEDKVEDFDYKKGYEGLRSWQTKLSQELAELKKEKHEQASIEKQPAVNQSITQNDWNEWYAQDPAAANAFIAQQNIQPVQQEIGKLNARVNVVLAKEAFGRFKESHSDFEEHRDEVLEELGVFPKEMLDNPDHFDTVLNTAYYAAKGKKQKSYEASIRENERAKLEVKQRSKADAYVETSTKAATEETLDPSKMSSDELMQLMRSKGVGPKD